MSDLPIEIYRMMQLRPSFPTTPERGTPVHSVYNLALLADSRDVVAAGHLERVRQYSRLLAEELRHVREFGRPEPAFVDLVELASPLHDIGKLITPKQVLLKPGRLTAEEFEIMKLHTTHGAGMLRTMPDPLLDPEVQRAAIAIAQFHHERFDGRGYPNGLSGRNIPAAARIVAFADAYDAITSPRVYKHALPHAEADARLRRDRGLHFDPLVVDAFERIADKFAEIASVHAPHRMLAKAA